MAAEVGGMPPDDFLVHLRYQKLRLSQIPNCLR